MRAGWHRLCPAIPFMGEQAEQLKTRTRKFALDVITLVKLLPSTEPAFTIRRQLTKAATSVSANYRAACRSRSTDEFIAKMGLVAEEADEAEHWLDVLGAAGLAAATRLESIHQEARELRAIFATSHATAKRNRARRSGGRR